MNDLAHQSWLFSNKPQDSYKDELWDMRAILQLNEYSIGERNHNRAKVRPGDTVYMRIFGDSFIGHFRVASEWTRVEASRQKWLPKVVAGVFLMRETQVWERPLPQSLVINELSNQNHRIRIIRLKSE